MIFALKIRLTAAIVRSVVYFQMWAADTTLDGMIKAREQVSDPFTRIEMSKAITVARAEAMRLREKYISLRRPSAHWRVA